MSNKQKISPSLEDYLETILFLSQKNDIVRVTDVASEMNISKPSVNKAVNILKNQELVSHEHYGSLSLTENGLEIATNVARIHMVLKKFLKDLLNVEEETAEKEACLIEHRISSDTIEKLSNYLNTVL